MFSFLFSRGSAEEHVARYVIREHERGRSLNEILEDKYVQNRLTPEQQRRLLDRPEIVGAISAATSIEDAKATITASARGSCPTPAHAPARTRLRPERDVPRGEPVRLEDDDVVVRLPAGDLARDDLVQLVHLEPVEDARLRRARRGRPTRAWPARASRSTRTRALEDGVVELAATRRRSRPRAITSAPGSEPFAAQRPGSRELVIVTTTSCSRRLAMALCRLAPVRSQNAASFSGVRQ